MSFAATHGLLPNFRLSGHGLGGANTALRYFGPQFYNSFSLPLSYPYGAVAGYYYPLVADSYDPRYATPQTKFGSCNCFGARVTQNKCNYGQGGFYPQCLANGRGCRCANFQGEFGCYNDAGTACI